MTLSRTTPSRSGTATAWPKKRSQQKNLRATSKTKSPTTASKNKFVYSFGAKKAEGSEDQKALLGGKGANLHGMTRLGLPVPPGFTISTEVCNFFYSHKNTYPKGMDQQLKTALAKIESVMKRKFGSRKKPLLVSVRSGARASMPGMMDTILNLGLNDETILGLIEESKDARFSYDSYRRLIAMYSDVVLGIHSNQFEIALEDMKHQRGVEHDTELSAEDLKKLVAEYKKIVKMSGREFPEDPTEQLWGAVGAVFNSWMSPRAITYRRLNDIPESWGTAVNVQAMVFGNMGDDCATGVAFTRDPSTGEKRFFGEYLINAQGEDVVAGIRTPQSIEKLKSIMPKPYKELVAAYQKLEKHYRDMQDIEFTIERGRFFMLQTRTGKRTAAASMRIAVEMVNERLITKNEAILRIHPDQIDQLLHPTLDPKAPKKVVAKGLPASPGAATGQVVFDPDSAETWVKQGKKVILVRIETSPEDIHGMSVAEGILTARGGMTSHAAVVARGMGKPCVSGCSALKISEQSRTLTIDSNVIREGEFITIDGASGEVILGKVPTVSASMGKHFHDLMKWVDDVRALRVRANADTPNDARVAREFGAEGIGLCRTEHMFFEPTRIDAVREMILSDDEAGRKRALDKILPMQKEDFIGIFREMKGLPVTIRLLDPPLHEFIPHSDEDLRALADKIHVPFERIKRKAESLHEFNPMLGHRGCRLGISFPEIYITQIRAIIEAACELVRDEKFSIVPEIMIPLVGDYRELKFVSDYCKKEADAIIARFSEENKKFKLTYLIGTMIELPRAALTADEIASPKLGGAEFFSFGTNDLTQTTYGLSRDDSGSFLKDYLEAKIYERDPFASLDATGVSRLMNLAVAEGRKSRPDLKIGICGEHGGDPASIELCHNMDLDYVSCSPYRVPIARLAAAQAQLKK